MLAMPVHRDGQEARSDALRTCSDVVARRLDDEMVLVHLRTNHIFTLSKTAAMFWELLQDGVEDAAIRRRLRQAFDIDEAELDAEISALLSRLRAEGLVCDR